MWYKILIILKGGMQIYMEIHSAYVCCYEYIKRRGEVLFL